MNLGVAVARIVRRFRTAGLSGVIESVLDITLGRWRTDAFDRANGVQTAGNKPVYLMRTNSPNVALGTRYAPIPESEFNQVFRQLPIAPADLTFIDVGSGKGRALLMASKMGFRRVIGVEYDADMCEIARQNVAKMKAPVEVVCSDIVDFTFPDEDTVVFLFNPFVGDVFAKFMTRIEQVAHRRLLIVYIHARQSSYIDASARFERVEGLKLENETLVWRSRP